MINKLVDHYPTRVADIPEVIERKDPVFYGNESEGPLSIGERIFYSQNGFILIKRFFTEKETSVLREKAEEWKEQSRYLDADEVIREKESEEIRSIFDIHRNHQFFKQLSRDPKLLAVVKQILGDQVYIHQSRINYKPGFTGKEFYWHSDFETWHAEDGMPQMRALSCSIWLDDNYSYNGPLMVIPKSHKYFISCVGETPDNHYKQSLRKQEYGVPDKNSLTWLIQQNSRIEVPEGPAGSILLFDSNLMHGSSSNITPYPRSNVFFVYNSVENRLVEPFSGKRPRPEFIASRDFEVL